MHSDNQQPALSSWFILILLALVWGTSYILIKYALKTFDPLQLASLRVCIAFLTLVPLLFIGQLKNFSGRQWLPVALTGLLGSAIPALLFAIAQTRISSSLAAILNALVPLSTLVTGALFFSQRMNRFKIAGVLLGITGTAGIILTRTNGTLATDNTFYSLLVILAGLCYALQTNILKRYLGQASPLGITAWGFAFSGPMAALIAVSSGVPEVIYSRPDAWKGVVYVSILGAFGTAAAIALFSRLVQNTTPLFASTVTYLIPLVALLWGTLDGEIITLPDIAGLIAILAGIYLTSR
ncbi:MAG: hypothetical protein KatS3mg031_0989 [Chitinophagales bacterium]|nr:MAG: hypothetical protein KatS3mg031_0989 [Chitinophagales bacterium]